MIQSQTNGTQQPNTTPEYSDLLLQAPAAHSLANSSPLSFLCPHWSCCCPRTHVTATFLSQAWSRFPLPVHLPPYFHSCLRRPKHTSAVYSPFFVEGRSREFERANCRAPFVQTTVCYSSVDEHVAYFCLGQP